LRLMVEAGLSPTDALRSATTTPAAFLAQSTSFGEIKTGQRADLVLLDANPLIDIANVGRVRAVVVAGRLLDRPELDTLIARGRFGASQH
jgi:imidazolonepropionase-like amidohydrolase